MLRSTVLVTFLSFISFSLYSMESGEGSSSAALAVCHQMLTYQPWDELVETSDGKQIVLPAVLVGEFGYLRKQQDLMVTMQNAQEEQVKEVAKAQREEGEVVPLSCVSSHSLTELHKIHNNPAVYAMFFKRYVLDERKDRKKKKQEDFFVKNIQQLVATCNAADFLEYAQGIEVSSAILACAYNAADLTKKDAWESWKENFQQLAPPLHDCLKPHLSVYKDWPSIVESKYRYGRIALVLPHKESVKEAIFSDDNNYIVTLTKGFESTCIYYNHTMYIWDRTTGKRVNEIKYKGAGSLDLKRSTSKVIVAKSSEYSSEYYVWNLSTCKGFWSKNFGISGDGNSLVIKKYPDGSRAERLSIIDLTTGKKRQCIYYNKLLLRKNNDSPLYVNRDCTAIAFIKKKNKLWLINPETKSAKKLKYGAIRPTQESHIRGTSFNHEGTVLASCRQGYVHLWDVETRALKQVITCGYTPCIKALFNAADNKMLIVPEFTSQPLLIADVATGKIDHTLKCFKWSGVGVQIEEAQWYDNDTKVRMFSKNGIRTWDAFTGKKLYESPTPASSYIQLSPEGEVIGCNIAVDTGSVRLSPDGKHIAWNTKVAWNKDNMQAYRSWHSAKKSKDCHEESKLQMAEGESCVAILQLPDPKELRDLDLLSLGLLATYANHDWHKKFYLPAHMKEIYATLPPEIKDVLLVNETAKEKITKIVKGLKKDKGDHQADDPHNKLLK